MNLQEITDGMRERVGDNCGLGATIKFDFGLDGIVMLDAVTVPNVVSNDEADADCVLTISISDFVAMVEGELDGTSAFMMGKLKVDGDMGIAMKLQGILSV